MIVYQQQGEANPYVVVETGGYDESLYGMASRLLELVKSTFLGRGNPLPERETVYMTPIPADCEQVAVLFSGWNPTPGMDGPMTCENFRWMGDFSIIVTRCTPAVAAKTTKTLTPETEKMSTAARMSSDDAEAFLEVLQGIGEFANPSVIVQSPMGGFQTVEFNVSIPAGGI